MTTDTMLRRKAMPLMLCLLLALGLYAGPAAAEGDLAVRNQGIADLIEGWKQTYATSPQWDLATHAEEAPDIHGMPEEGAIPVEDALKTALDYALDNFDGVTLAYLQTLTPHIAFRIDGDRALWQIDLISPVAAENAPSIVAYINADSGTIDHVAYGTGNG